MKNNFILKTLINPSQWSLIQLCVIFFSVTTLLFVLMILLFLLPKLTSTFNDFSVESNKLTAAAYSEKLNQYIYDRELALKDIADHALVTNATLQGEGDRPALLDYMSYVTLLGKDPHLSIIDIAGEVLYTELQQGVDYHWVKPLLNMEVNQIVNIIEDSENPQFEIAVPIQYGGSTEGVLVARISAYTSQFYGENYFAKNNSSISYSKADRTITSNSGEINIPHSESLIIESYDIVFTYTSDQSLINDERNTLLWSFIFSTCVGAIGLFTVLFFIGRKVIIKPFQESIALQSAISSAVEGISRIDTEGRYITLNKAYAGAAGYTPEELEGQPWTVTVYEEDLPGLNDAYATMLKEGKVTAEARGLKKDGSIFYKRVTMISQYDEHEQFIGHHCFLKDITASKIIEEKVIRQQRELQLIFDNVPVRIWYKDDENRILRLNKQAADSMGGDVADFEGKDTYDLFPDMAKKYHEDDLEVINSKQARFNIVEKYTPLNSPPSWVSTDKIPYINEETKEKFIFVCSKDITKEKQNEENLKRLNEELSQFAYRTSHDLKAPLVSISGLVNFIIEDAESGEIEEVKRNAKMIKTQSDKLSALVTDILDLARADFDDSSLEIVNFKALIDDILGSLPNENSDIVINKHIQDSVSFPMQLTRIRQVLYNLLSNGMKYYDPSKTVSFINVSISTEKNKLIILIEDNGLGFPEQAKNDLFKMFKRYHPKVSTGSGLGMSIVKKHVDSMGGDIQLITTNGNTCFKLTFLNY